MASPLLSTPEWSCIEKEWAALHETLGRDKAQECGHILRQCMAAKKALEKEHHSAAVALAECAVAECWDALHMGDWRDVEPHWRQLYGLSAFIVAAAALQGPLPQHRQAMELFDVVTMLSGPRVFSSLPAVIALLQQIIDEGGSSLHGTIDTGHWALPPPTALDVEPYVPRYEKVSLQQFQELMLKG